MLSAFVSDRTVLPGVGPLREVRLRWPSIDWGRVAQLAAACGDGAGDAVMLVLALAPAAVGFALLLAAFGLVRI